MGYQSFPWQQGSSNSFYKLLSLALPRLKGKYVLDAGCNNGFFCGWADFQKATRVEGIDRNPEFIEQAKLWFNNCYFYCKDWTDLGDRKYDVILCLSALHYAKDQRSLIDMFMDHLSPSGVLVLEVGIAEGNDDEFIPIARSIHSENDDVRFFPTLTKMKNMLGESYSYKYIGKSVMQAGDPLTRHVFHVQHRLPMAVLLLDPHYSGKSSVVDNIIRPDILRIFGENIYTRIAEGELAASESLKECIYYLPNTRHMIPPEITKSICERGLLPEFIETVIKLSEKKDFILEHFIPQKFRMEVANLLQKAGFFVIDIALFSAVEGNVWLVDRPKYKEYEAYTKYLEKLCDIDEEAYMAANPDVFQAVQQGIFPNAKYHYWHFGRRDKRKLR